MSLCCGRRAVLLRNSISFALLQNVSGKKHTKFNLVLAGSRTLHSIKISTIDFQQFSIVNFSLLRASSRRGLNDIILILGYSHIVVVAGSLA